MTTTKFYNNNSTDLINRYDSANMSSLHKLLLKYIPHKSSVLDIGFGSGRDLQFLHDNSYDIWGIDPSTKFVENAKKRFIDKNNHFIKGSIPFESELLDLSVKFDAVISIAVWMHLERSKYKDVVSNISSITKTTSSVVISYSKGRRVDDERYFEDVDIDYLTELFKNEGFYVADIIKNEDSFNRNTLTWITVVYKHD